MLPRIPSSVRHVILSDPFDENPIDFHLLPTTVESLRVKLFKTEGIRFPPHIRNLRVDHGLMLAEIETLPQSITSLDISIGLSHNVILRDKWPEFLVELNCRVMFNVNLHLIRFLQELPLSLTKLSLYYGDRLIVPRKSWIDHLTNLV